MSRRRPVAVLAAALAALLASCGSADTPFTKRDAMGQRPAQKPPPREDAWRWVVDAEVQRGGVEGGVPLPRSGLVVVSGSVPSTSSSAPSHAMVEAVAAPVPVGEAVWRRGAYAGAATADPIWEGATVAVEWVVSIARRGSCLVEVTLVPRLVHPTGCVAILDDLKVVRVLSLDEGIAVAVDERSPASAVGRSLLGSKAAPTGPARLVFRVRGGA